MDLSRRINDRLRRRPWELLILLLALLMSLSCVFLATWLALRVRPDVLAEANMLPKSRADYRRLPSEETPFAPLDPAVVIEAATDVAQLARTPVSSATLAGIVFLPPTPTVTPTPTPSPTPDPDASSGPVPTPSPMPTATDWPTPTNPPPTATPTVVPPTSTSTTTRAPTPTPVPTETLAPTFTPVPTNTPIPTSTATATDTPVPTSTPPPTDTPAPPTPTEVRPVVQSILPNTMVNTDTVTVTITGLNFEASCSASLDSTPLLVSSCTPTTTVAASVPADMVAGYYDLTVTNPDDQSGTLPNAYTATNPIPLVTAITPGATAITSTDLTIDIIGDYFRSTGSPGSLRANLGGTPLTSLTYVSPTTLTATVPASSPIMALGTYTLTVTNPGPTDPTAGMISAFTVFTYTEMCDPVPACYDAVGPGEPNGIPVNLLISDVITITIDFGVGNGISDGPGYDMVFYEWPNPDIDPDSGVLPGILLDYITIQLVDESSGAAYTVFEWDGDNPGDVAGTNIDGYATDTDPKWGGERDNEPIPWYDLVAGPPSSPHNSGIAIDIGVAAQAVQPPQRQLPDGPFRWVRVSVPAGASDGAQVDAIVRLN